MNKEESNITLEDYVRILNQYQELQQENKQLKDNWNILKGYLEHSIDFERLYRSNSLEDIYREILDKIKELEEGVK